MPKSSPAKKRKENKEDNVSGRKFKKAKRTKKQQASEKCDGKLQKHSKDEVVDCNESVEQGCPEIEINIDQELDRNASKSNLSVFNVKSILHVSMAGHFA